MLTDIEESEARANALLAERKITEAQQRSACATLADRALIVTGWSEEAEDAGTWDERAAKAMLCEALEAIGRIPYQRTPGRYFYGQAEEL